MKSMIFLNSCGGEQKVIYFLKQINKTKCYIGHKYFSHFCCSALTYTQIYFYITAKTLLVYIIVFVLLCFLYKKMKIFFKEFYVVWQQQIIKRRKPRQYFSCQFVPNPVNQTGFSMQPLPHLPQYFH